MCLFACWRSCLSVCPSVKVIIGVPDLLLLLELRMHERAQHAQKGTACAKGAQWEVFKYTLHRLNASFLTFLTFTNQFTISGSVRLGAETGDNESACPCGVDSGLDKIACLTCGFLSFTLLI